MSLSLFGIMRGGSSVVTDVFFKVAIAGGLPYVDPVTELYDQGVEIHSLLVQEKTEWALAQNNNSVIGIFRELPNWVWSNSFKNCKKVLIIRDPRDCLVSLFHIRKKHSLTLDQSNNIPNGFNIDQIDHFSLVYQKYFRERFDAYLEFLACFPDILVIRYEDIIDNFGGFLELVISLLADQGGDVDAMRTEASVIASTVSMVKRNASNDGAHNRSGKSMQFISELKIETIRELTRTFSTHLSFFCYRSNVINFDKSFLFSRDDNEQVTSRLDYLIDFNRILAAENGARIEEIRQLKEQINLLRAC